MNSLFSQRLSKLQNVLKEASCEAFLVDDKINLFYLTGLDLSAGKLVVTNQGGTLIVDHRYLERCQQSAPFPVVIEESKAMEKAIHGIKTLGFNREITSYGAYLDLQTFTQNLTETIHLIPMGDLVKGLRSIKDVQEISLLMCAAELCSAGFDFVMSQLTVGVTEREIATSLEIFWKQGGSQGPSFDPMIAFGSHGAMPHYRSDDVPLKLGDPILIDIGVCLDHYHSDMARVVFFGEPSTKMRDVYEMVRTSQEGALSVCHPGTTVAELDDAARLVFAEKGYGDYFTHSVGHGIGLEIHEQPVLKNSLEHADTILEEGMVITVEPGLYLPKEGGVRIEDTVVITETGHENLTRVPKDIQIITTETE